MKDSFIVPQQPGVSWMTKDQYPCPIDSIAWGRIFEPKEISVVGDTAGLIETLGAMACGESLSKDISLVWMMKTLCPSLLDRQLLFKKGIGIDLPQGVKEYTVPYFKDIDGKQYLNTSYYRHSRHGTLESVVATSCLPFQQINWRNGMSLEQCNKDIGFKLDKPIFLILPERTGWSRHEFDAMKMSVMEVRELIDLLVKEGIQPVVMVKEGNQHNYMIRHYGKIFYSGLNVDGFVALAKICKGIVSKDIDCILATIMLGESKIFSIGGEVEHSPMRNAKAINKYNHIYTRSKLKPMEIMEQLKEIDGRSATNSYWFNRKRDD